MTVQVDLRDPAFTSDPYPTYARLRAEAPVCKVRTPTGLEFWLITRYGDVLTVLKDPRFANDRRRGGAPPQLLSEALDVFAHMMLSFDPPDHTRLRRLVQMAFTPRIIEHMRPRVQQIADELLDAVAGAGQFDLIDAYASPLPVTVIAELLGIPLEDGERFRVWSNIIASGAFVDASQERQEAMLQFAVYLRALFDRRRAAPGDDLVSALVQVEEAGDRLSEKELTSMVFLLIFAGHETTVNLIGSGALALFEHPDQLARLRAEPALIENAVEELLRYTSPAQGSVLRLALEDVTLSGQLIQRGELVMVLFAAANRDAEQFAEADRLDLSRPESRHLAFGHGLHYCLGAPLARLEGAVAFETLLRRMPGLRLAIPIEDVEWRPGFFLHGLKRLPVAF